jgi:hypothetical protein
MGRVRAAFDTKSPAHNLVNHHDPAGLLESDSRQRHHIHRQHLARVLKGSLSPLFLFRGRLFKREYERNKCTSKGNSRFSAGSKRPLDDLDINRNFVSVLLFEIRSYSIEDKPNRRLPRGSNRTDYGPRVSSIGCGIQHDSHDVI